MLVILKNNVFFVTLGLLCSDNKGNIHRIFKWLLHESKYEYPVMLGPTGYPNQPDIRTNRISGPTGYPDQPLFRQEETRRRHPAGNTKIRKVR